MFVWNCLYATAFLSSAVLDLSIVNVPIKLGLLYKCPINNISWQGKEEKKEERQAYKKNITKCCTTLNLCLYNIWVVTYISPFLRNDIVLDMWNMIDFSITGWGTDSK